MNADDLKKYQGLLERRRDLLEFLNYSTAPIGIIVHVPGWLDLETARMTSERAAGVFVDDKEAMAIIIDQARQAAHRQIQRIEEELTAAGITFAPGIVPGGET